MSLIAQWLPAAVVLAMAGRLTAAALLVYVGTYTGPSSKGIYAYRFDPSSGTLKALGLAAETENPSWVAADRKGEHLYAVNETDNGALTAFRIDAKTGKLTRLDRVSSLGAAPCALAVDATGRALLAANYTSGTLALAAIGNDGRLAQPQQIAHHGSSVNQERQAGPHAHSALFSPDNRFALSCDLGLDKVFVYRFDPSKPALALNQEAPVPPGSGPRHLAFHPNGRFAFVINEMTSTVTSFAWDAAAGKLSALATVESLPGDYRGLKSGAEIQVHPEGKFLYVSNRDQASSITVFAIDGNGALKQVERVSSGGSEPRNFVIDPSGAWLLAANQKSDNLVTFRIDRRTGRLSLTGAKVEVGAPVSIAFVAAK